MAARREAAATIGRRRRWVVVGPGLIVAVMVAVVLLWIHHGELVDRPRTTATAASPAATVPPAPDLGFVLNEAGALRLTDEQRRELKRLVKRFGTETGEARAVMEQASGEFSRQMQEQGGKPMRLSELQEQTAVVGELSRHVAAARRRYWEQGAKVLTAAQRAQAEALWVDHLAVRRQSTHSGPAGVGVTP